SYSWGFSEETEKEDREFILHKLENFKKLGIKTHAYIQGANLIYKDYSDKDWYAEDFRNKKVVYHRGRYVVCVNNPEFQEYISQKIKEAAAYDFDGIFVDNIQMGQLGIPFNFHRAGFAGCNCRVCRKKFKDEYSFDIPADLEPTNQQVTSYLKFRLESTEKFLKKISKVAKNSNKEFATNSFDPKFDMNYTYGTDIEFIEKYQDYILFENHSFPSQNKNNKYIDEYAKSRGIKKDVFVVSYKNGIGFDKGYSQSDIDMIFSEAQNTRFNLCLKGSEYTTKRIWHNLEIKKLSKPKLVKSNYPKPVRLSAIYRVFFLKFLIKKYSNTLLYLYFNNFLVRKILSPFYKYLV
ncbi:MAG TPA: putative glycoside hydrolase, partial [Candidatus Dojkabacteria bacterium]